MNVRIEHRLDGNPVETHDIISDKCDFIIGRKDPGTFPQPDIALGRGHRADHISRRHLSIWYAPQSGWWVECLGTTNPTYLNGQRLNVGVVTQLSDRSSVEIGQSVIQFHLSAHSGERDRAIDVKIHFDGMFLNQPIYECIKDGNGKPFIKDVKLTNSSDDPLPAQSKLYVFIGSALRYEADLPPIPEKQKITIEGNKLNLVRGFEYLGRISAEESATVRVHIAKPSGAVIEPTYETTEIRLMPPKHFDIINYPAVIECFLTEFRRDKSEEKARYELQDRSKVFLQSHNLVGKEPQTPEEIKQFVECHYCGLMQAGDIPYLLEPDSVSRHGQLIRSPSEILMSSNNVRTGGTCIDLAVMFAVSLCQSHLEPIVIITQIGGNDYHALVAIWNNNSSNNYVLCQRNRALIFEKVRDLISQNELLVLDPLGFTNDDRYRCTFDEAIRRGTAQLKSASIVHVAPAL